MTPNENDAVFPYDLEDELVNRLRSLRWPEPTPEVRQRCWEDFKLRTLPDPDGFAEASGMLTGDHTERHDFTRHVVPMRAGAVVGHHLAVHDGARRLARR